MKITSHHPFLSNEARDRYLRHNDERSRAWPVACECNTLETSYGPTFVRSSGSEGAPPLFLLPGGGTHSLMWIPNIAGLSRSYRTHALDSILDVGRSANTRPVKTVDELTSWLDEVIEMLAPRSKVRLMGLSHGGWLAANYAKRHSERIEKLVLLAPAGWVLPLRPAMLLAMMQILLPPRRFFIRRSYYYSLPDLVASGPDGRGLIEEMTEDLALAFSCFGVRRLMRMLEPTVAVDESIRSIQAFTLFVIGEKERIYSANDALDRLSRIAPHIRTAMIPGTGHDMTWLKPDLVNEIVLEFLEGDRNQRSSDDEVERRLDWQAESSK